MKRFVEMTVQFKFIWGIFFTAAMLLYTTANMIIGNNSMELILVWQIVAITLIVTLFHYLIFGEFILKSLSVKLKILVHSILCYITLFISALTLNWISIENFSSITTFTVSYTLIYLACVFSFYIYYKSTGEELNKKLLAYKQNKKSN